MGLNQRAAMLLRRLVNSCCVGVTFDVRSSQADSDAQKVVQTDANASLKRLGVIRFLQNQQRTQKRAHNHARNPLHLPPSSSSSSSAFSYSSVKVKCETDLGLQKRSGEGG
eukprot:TRINITY_DN12867_c0_g1_i1.p1 TRINITY_DN12867_c0_g1~~TRINITY_DN12867_c0_g1_i1.p1  ORF type:complete len:111 (+),score=4.38 TRINITY_DN12867_c0_g1_i1:346-678(+)